MVSFQRSALTPIATLQRCHTQTFVPRPPRTAKSADQFGRLAEGQDMMPRSRAFSRNRGNFRQDFWFAQGNLGVVMGDQPFIGQGANGAGDGFGLHPEIARKVILPKL